MKRIALALAFLLPIFAFAASPKPGGSVGVAVDSTGAFRFLNVDSSYNLIPSILSTGFGFSSPIPKPPGSLAIAVDPTGAYQFLQVDSTGALITNGQAASPILTTLAGLANSAGVLTNSGTGALSWGAGGGGSGTVTQIIAGTGLSGGTITTSGTISVNNATLIGVTTPTTISAAGNTALTWPAGALRQMFNCTCTAGSGAYLATLTLGTTNVPADAQATVVINLPASANPSVELLDQASARMDGTQGVDAATVVIWTCRYNGSAWFITNRLPLADKWNLTMGSTTALTIDSPRQIFVTASTTSLKLELPNPNAGMTRNDIGFQILNAGAPNTFTVTDYTGTGTIYATEAPTADYVIGWTGAAWVNF